MAWKSLSDSEIRMMLAVEFDDISSEDVIEDHDYVSFDDDGEIDEIFQVLVISDEEVEDNQIFTEQTLAKNENYQMSFATKYKTEKWTSNPQSD